MIPETTRRTTEAEMIGRIFPLRRPCTLAASALIGARRYRRQRDLPGAVPGLLAGDEAAILPRLIAEERRCEQARRARTGGYRPGEHVQILSALLAEAAAFRKPAEAARPLRPAAPAAACRARPAVPEPARAGSPAAPFRQAKASGSAAFRSAM